MSIYNESQSKLVNENEGILNEIHDKLEDKAMDNNGTAPTPTGFTLHWADYTVFGVALMISVVIGFICSCRGDRKVHKTPADLLTGGRKMKAIPVSLSLLASSLNGVFIIGAPAEVYYYGAVYAFIGLGWLFVIPVTAHVFAPHFHKMSSISAYEYLERRFSVVVRILGSATFVVAMTLFLGVVLYAPALAFSVVTGLPMFMATTVCGLVVTKYTVLGGLPAVIWVDVFQIVLVFVALIVLVSVGSADVAGGSHKVWSLNNKHGRLNFNTFSADPRERHTFWTQTLGMFFAFLPLFATNQMMIQRYMSVPTVRDIQIALYVMYGIVVILLVLVVALGLVMFGYYHDCDPYESGYIEEKDHIVPWLMIDLLGEYHGLPGLFIASVFAACLSSASSALNSLSATILEDFVKVGVRLTNTSMTPKTAGWITRAICLLFGIVMIGLSFAADELSHSLIQIPVTIWGVVGGPLLGLFTLGFFVPCCNSWGGGGGLLAGLCFNLWLILGNKAVWNKPPETLSLTSCRTVNDSFATSTLTPHLISMTSVDDVTSWTPGNSGEAEDESLVEQFYQISYTWYGLIGFVMCMLVGILLSWISDGIAAGCYRSWQTDEEHVVVKCVCCQTHDLHGIGEKVQENAIQTEKEKTDTEITANGYCNPVSEDTHL